MSVLQIDRRSIANFDKGLLAAVLLINIIGIINLASAAAGTGLWKTQLYWFLLWTAVSAAVLFVDYQQYEKYANFLFVVALIALLGVHFFGHKVAGATSWYRIGIGGFRSSFQPSETAKLAIILMLARYYHHDTQGRPWGLRELVWPGVIIGLPLLSILKEPDMGTALTIVLFAGTMLLFAGVRTKVIVIAALVGILSVYPAWKWVLRPHQRERILNVVYPERASETTGYHAFQSKVAVGSGGMFGKGYKQGSMHMLRFLPAQQTDFVFGVWAEEWGFFWVAFILSVYAFIVIKGILAAKEAKDRFGVMLAVGASALLFWHIFVNVAMVVGIFPIIGVPLPYMTYGGSNLLTFMIAVSLIMNVRMRKYFF